MPIGRVVLVEILFDPMRDFPLCVVIIKSKVCLRLYVCFDIDVGLSDDPFDVPFCHFYLKIIRIMLFNLLDLH